MKHSQEIQAKFEATNVASQLIVLEGAGHGFRGKHADRAVAELVTWFEKHLTDQ